jgi:hypothetical protein
MAMTPEARIKHRVKKWLNDRGVWFFCPVSNGMGKHGIPDFICCWNGKFLAIECKAPGKLNTCTPNQLERQKEIRAAGGIALVVDNVLALEELELKGEPDA